MSEFTGLARAALLCLLAVSFSASAQESKSESAAAAASDDGAVSLTCIDRTGLPGTPDTAWVLGSVALADFLVFFGPALIQYLQQAGIEGDGQTSWTEERRKFVLDALLDACFEYGRLQRARLAPLP